MCVLVVEDEWIILLAAEASLLDAGYYVMPAATGAEAKQYIDDLPGYFTCLVTDYHMPGGVTGAHVVEHIRPRYPTIPIIVASAMLYVMTDGWCRQHGVELLQKPYEQETLVSLVGRVMQR